MLKAFSEAIAIDLRERGLDAVEVTDFEDETQSTGYCDTCYYEYAVVKITYKDSDGALKNYTISESFAEYIKYLTD